MTIERSETSADIHDIGRLAEKSRDVLSNMRDGLFEPDPEKPSPFFTTASVAKLCDVSRRRIADLSIVDGYPSGHIPEDSNTKHFTVQETQEYVRRLKNLPRRPDNQRGRIIAISVFKGGTAKTTVSLSLAQGLALNYGYRVLIIDGDPQGSLGTHIGLQPEVNIPIQNTLMPYIFGDEPNLRYAVQKTYWDNIDIIPGNYNLYEADFHLPMAFMQSDRKDQFWNAMKPGLHEIANDYDVIIIDTPPAMNYLTISMVYAADAIIQPIPPRSVDFASATQFWTFLHRLLVKFTPYDPEVEKKIYDFIAIVPSRVKPKEITDAILSQMSLAFDKYLTNNNLPESSAIENLSFMLQTIYDQPIPKSHIEDHRRYKDRMDELVAIVNRGLLKAWGIKQKGVPK